MSNRLIAILVAAGIVLVAVLSSVFVVNAREQAIVLRFSAIERVHQEPGLYFKIPFIESVLRFEDRLLRLDLDNQLVQVTDGKRYLVDAFLTYEIGDPERFRRIAQTQARAEDLLGARFETALRNAYATRGFEAALSAERSVMMQEVAEVLRPAAQNFGVQIKDVRIRRTDLTQDVSAQTFERMKAERLAEAENLRARGAEAARRIKAAANRQVVEIRAEAQKESEILRGEGEGERNRIFAEAFSKDPSFFAFYRSMSAYKKALENSGTTMVLSPDSEFFRYFQDANGPANGPTITPSSAPSSSGPVLPSPVEATQDTTTETVEPEAPAASTDGTAAPSDGLTAPSEPGTVTIVPVPAD